MQLIQSDGACVMKKYKCMAGILAVLLISTFFSTPSMGADGEQPSGNVSAQKYSKAEICKIIENNYNYAIRDIYEVKPSSKPPYKPGRPPGSGRPPHGPD